MRRVRQAGLGIALAVFVAAPVGAGATGHSALAMLVFAGMFLLANAVMRPASVRLDAPGALAAQVLTAAALAALLVSLGQTIRALGRLEAELELFGWAFLAAWALVLARIVWPPRMTDRIGRGAEAVLREVHRSGEAPRRARRPAPTSPPPDRPPPPRDTAAPARPSRERAAPGRAVPPPPAAEPVGPEPPAAQPRPEAGPRPAPDPGTAPAPAGPPLADPAPAAMTGTPAMTAAPPPPPSPALAAALARLDRLPTLGATADDLAAALDGLAEAAPPDAVFAQLAARATPEGAERDRRALVRHATDPSVAARQAGQGAPAATFEAIVAAADAVSLAEFAPLSLALLEALPEARGDYPTVARLLEIADQIEAEHETEAELLVALAHELEDLALEAEDSGPDA